MERNEREEITAILRKEAVIETVTWEKDHLHNGGEIVGDRAHYSVVAFSNLPYHLQKWHRSEREKALRAFSEKIKHEAFKQGDIPGTIAPLIDQSLEEALKEGETL